jgi:glycosyltransferase involved in cell wall biosynthesis
MRRAIMLVRPKASMISLIVSTRNRMQELDRFLVHLDRQTYRDFEVLVVDQNSGDGVEALLKGHDFPQKYFRSDKPGIASGRNVALHFAKGEIFAIPDDDCWYPPDLLERVADWFDQHADVGMLCILECNDKGEAMVPPNPLPAGFCTEQPVGWFRERSIWTFQSSMVFLRRSVRDTIGNMDESIGVGSTSKYQSGEETDYFLRAMHAGFKMWFEPSLKVFHPELRELQRIRKTNYKYSVGGGRLLRKHRFPLPRMLAVVGRALGGAVVSVCRLDFPMVSIYFKRGIGTLVGYFGK